MQIRLNNTVIYNKRMPSLPILKYISPLFIISSLIPQLSEATFGTVEQTAALTAFERKMIHAINRNPRHMSNNSSNIRFNTTIVYYNLKSLVILLLFCTERNN